MRGLREHVTIMIGGAPISQGFADEIKTDFYATVGAHHHLV